MIGVLGWFTNRAHSYKLRKILAYRDIFISI